jgi:hypothetical protein
VGSDIPCRLTFSISRTTLTGFASGLLLGLSVYRHSTSVSRNRKSAWTIEEDIADRVSLSPNLISCTSAQPQPSISPTYRYRHRIVLIDDGHDSHRQQFRESVLSVQIPRPLYYQCPEHNM